MISVANRFMAATRTTTMRLGMSRSAILGRTAIGICRGNFDHAVFRVFATDML